MHGNKNDFLSIFLLPFQKKFNVGNKYTWNIANFDGTYTGCLWIGLL